VLALMVGSTVERPADARQAEACDGSRTADCCAGPACAAVPDRILLDPARHRAPPADGAPSGSLDGLLEPIRARYRTPALVAAVWQGGAITAAGSAGVRAAGSPDAVGLADRFHFGSCGKAMTATLAGILVERGDISWDTTIEEVLPDLAARMREPYRAATLHQLLSHRGGFPQGRPDGLRELEGPRPAQRRGLVAVVGALEPVGAPGAVFNYSDLGYAVAGAMLEAATGSSWEALIVEHVAEPLGLASLGFGAPGSAAELSEPRGHVLRGDAREAVVPGPAADGAVPALGPAGTIHASVTDWAAFAGAHLDARRGAAALRLSREGFGLLHADRYRQGYALGWGLQRVDERIDLVHSGSCGRWAAVVRVIPEHDTAVVVASNYGGQSAFLAVSGALEAIVEQHVPGP
jgi:CubicO group peptidase (beta-lactamase class C family)